MRRYNLIASCVVLFLMLAVSGSAWNQSSKGQKNSVVDTVPNKNQKKIVDLDEALQELDRAEIELQLELSKMDFEKMEKELKASLEKIDMTKIQKEIELSLKEVDMEKIKAEIAKSLKEVDWKKIQSEIDSSISKIDLDKMKIEMDQVKIEMEKLKEVDLKGMHEELAKIKPTIEKAMAEAKVDIEKARAEIKEYKTFLDGLEKDGLINQKSNYKIEHKDGVLKINGKVQPESVYNKYRSFLEKHKSITIDRDANDLDIDLD